MMDDSGILVKIIDQQEGLLEYQNVKIIRIISDKYNLLIMKDYVPIIGEFNGKIDIEMSDNKITYQHIKAFFMNSDNIFHLMIQEVIND